MSRGGAAVLALLGVALAARPCGAAEAIDPAPWLAGSYGGRVTLGEKAVAPGEGGAALKAPLDFPADISFLVLPPEKEGGSRRAILVRSAMAGAADRPLPLPGDVGIVRLAGPGSAPAPGGSPPGAGLLEDLFEDAIFPALDIPGPDGAEREERVPVEEGVVAALPLRARAAGEGTLLTITRSLVPGKAVKVEIDGSPASVEAWSETHVIDTELKVPRRIRRDHRVVLERDGERIAAEGSIELELEGARVLDEASRARALDLARGIEAVLEGFREGKHPREIYDLIKALPAREGTDLLRGLEDAIAAKFARYRLEREAELRRKAAPSRDPEAAPDFTLETLDGKRVSFKEATKGKVTLLTFWGYGCPPCRVEAPYLTRLQETYGDQGFTVFAVNAYDEPRELVSAFAQRGRLAYPILLMGRQVARGLYRVNRFPTSLWIDRGGKVVARESGFSPASFPRIEARVKEMLAGGTGAPAESR